MKLISIYINILNELVCKCTLQWTTYLAPHIKGC